MKKLVLAVLAVAVIAGAASAKGSEFKIKVGLETAGSTSISAGGDSVSGLGTNLGVGAAAEFLFPVCSIVKIGPGLEASFARNINDKRFTGNGYTTSLFFVPVYVTIEVNPIKSAPEVFFKGNIGYNIGQMTQAFNGSVLDSSPSGETGLYYGLGAGYQFPFGLFLDAMYSVNRLSDSLDDFGGYALTYSKLTISAGYKFNL